MWFVVENTLLSKLEPLSPLCAYSAIERKKREKKKNLNSKTIFVEKQNCVNIFLKYATAQS